MMTEAVWSMQDTLFTFFPAAKHQSMCTLLGFGVGELTYKSTSKHLPGLLRVNTYQVFPTYVVSNRSIEAVMPEVILT